MKKEVQDIYHAIKTISLSIIRNSDDWRKRLVGSKNFICTPDLQYWTFGKSVGNNGGYHYDGGVAKQRLYHHGFINVLQHPEEGFKEEIIESFRRWAKKVKGFPLEDKFNRDQLGRKAFELLVHKDIILQYQEEDDKAQLVQSAFDEGFKKHIVAEVKHRSAALIRMAKKYHGTICSVCNFNFGETYGSFGEGFIEMHHLSPISDGERISTVDDLRPVCANCHRMLHRGDSILSIAELKEIVEQEKANQLHHSKFDTVHES